MADFKVMGRVFTVEESEIKANMKEFNLNRDDAVRMYFEDMEIIPTGGKEPIKEVETVKEKRRYEKSDKPRKKTERVRKIDNDKKFLLEKMMETIDVEKTVKNETEFSFSYNGNDYTVKLIKHRPKKAESS